MKNYMDFSNTMMWVDEVMVREMVMVREKE